jgi:hypothetical protein
MASFLIVSPQEGSSKAWGVYLQVDPVRSEGDLIRALGPRVGSVTSWDELNALAGQHDVAEHQIGGEGLDQMTKELGPMPE